VVCSIVSDVQPYAEKVAKKLAQAGLVVETDFRNEKINYKVREHSLAKVPVIIAVGKRDEEAGTLAIRRLGEEGQKTFALDEAVASLAEEARSPLDR
jgi:threonyl-tRNA synthetase